MNTKTVINTKSIFINEVVSFKAMKDKVIVTELCDNYFFKKFTHDEFQKLINEMQELLNRSGR